MCGATSSEDEKTKSNESDGFKFAVTLLAASGTIIYTTYTYLQNNPIGIYWYALVCGLICVAAVLAFGLFLYIFIKGYLMEKYNDKQKGLEKLASSLYSITLLTSMILLLFILGAFACAYIKKFHPSLVVIADVVFFIVISSIILIFIVLLYLYFIKGKRWAATVVIALLLGMLIWHLLFDPVLISPLQGHITVEVDNIYYKDDMQIPVSIYVTGPNTGLLIKLYQKESGYDPILKDEITEYLEPENNLFKAKSGENLTLLANSLGSGKYNVFINTTDLTIGYYELICIRPKYDKSSKGFYLLKSSQRP